MLRAQATALETFIIDKDLHDHLVEDCNVPENHPRPRTRHHGIHGSDNTSKPKAGAHNWGVEDATVIKPKDAVQASA